MKDAKQLELKLGGSSHVRFSGKEYALIQKLAFKQSKTIPKLLKDTLFNGHQGDVLISRNDLTIIRKDLSKIGNNLNQVAKKLNSGFMHGWNDTFKEVKELLDTLTKQLHHGYGVYKG